jgi:hypothetical protein
MVGLGDFPGGRFDSDALAIAPGGTVVVGEGFTDTDLLGFRWKASSGLRSLGPSVRPRDV